MSRFTLIANHKVVLSGLPLAKAERMARLLKKMSPAIVVAVGYQPKGYR
jgi:hypothetical protein